MSLSKRLSLLISLLILMVSLTLGILAVSISTSIVRHDTEDWMLNEAEIGAGLVSLSIQNYLELLQVMADIPEVRSMNQELQKGALFPYIEEMGVDDIAVIDLQGNAWHLKGGQTVNLAQRSYVQKALAGQRTISDFIPASGSAVDTGYPLLNYAVPILVNKQPIGALLARTNAFILSDIIKTIEVRGTGYAYIFNHQGQTIAHAVERDAVVNLDSPLEKAKGDPAMQSLAGAVRYILDRQSGSTRYTYHTRRMLSSFAPIPGFDMILVLSAEERSLMGRVVFLRNGILVIVAAFVGLGVLAAFFIARSIARPLAFMGDTLQRIGEGDLTQELTIGGKDEIARIGLSLNQSTASVRSLVRDIKEQAAHLLSIGHDLSVNMAESAAAVNEISANIQSIKGRVINQAGSVNQTHAVMEQISVNANNLNSHVERQALGVTQTSQAIEAMLSNIQFVTQTLVKNAGNVRELTNASEAGRGGLQEVAADIQEIARESEGLLEINSVMENIASQTNLLSMNAAIEAAHAGEAGRGFAVVAGEIRKLAVSASEQSKTISAVLKRIKNSIDKITRSTDSVLGKFEAIDSRVRTVSEQEAGIRNAMEEQSAGGKQILEAVSQVNEITGQVKSGSKDMLGGSSAVIAESGSLSRISEEIAGGMNEMAVGAEQINIAVHKINDISAQNKEYIERLAEEVSRFKVE